MDTQTREELQRIQYVLSFFAPAAPLAVLQVLMVLAVIFLGWWSIPLELLMRKEFGSRYLSFLRLYMGYVVMGLFTFLFTFVGVLAGGISPLAFFGYSGSLRTLFANGGSSVLYHLVYWAVVGMACWHRYRIWRRERDGVPWHSMSFGISRLAAIPWQRLIDAVPGLSNYVTIDDFFLLRFVEPGMCYLVALGLRRVDSLLGWWLLIASVALFLKSNLVYWDLKGRTQDLMDANLEASYLSAALAGKDKQETAGWSVVPAPVEGLFEHTPFDLHMTVREALGADAAD